MNRIKYFDIARGIAIISIILGHLGNTNINRIVFTYHVPLFFVITGYFMKVDETVWHRVKKNARSLLVPYYITSIAITIGAILMVCLKGNYANVCDVAVKWIYATIYGAGDTYQTPFYIPAIGALWFLWASFWGSCLLKTILKCKNIVVESVFVFGAFLIGYYSRCLFWFPFSIQAGLCSSLFMYIGYLAKELEQKYTCKSRYAKAVLVLVSSLIWIQFMYNFKSFWLVHCDVGRGIIDIIGSLCAVYMIFVIAKFLEDKSHLLSAVLEFCGKNSLLVLCFHAIELDLFPYYILMEIMNRLEMSALIQSLIIIIIKIIWIFSLTFIAANNKFVKHVYGMEH